jgi:hypothetical protein
MISHEKANSVTSNDLKCMNSSPCNLMKHLASKSHNS